MSVVKVLIPAKENDAEERYVLLFVKRTVIGIAQTEYYNQWSENLDPVFFLWFKSYRKTFPWAKNQTFVKWLKQMNAFRHPRIEDLHLEHKTIAKNLNKGKFILNFNDWSYLMNFSIQSGPSSKCHTFERPKLFSFGYSFPRKSLFGSNDLTLLTKGGRNTEIIVDLCVILIMAYTTTLIFFSTISEYRITTDPSSIALRSSGCVTPFSWLLTFTPRPAKSFVTSGCFRRRYDDCN